MRPSAFAVLLLASAPAFAGPIARSSAPSYILPALESAVAQSPSVGTAAAAPSPSAATPWDPQAYFKATTWLGAMIDRAPAAGGASHPILDVQFDGRLSPRQAASVLDTLTEIDDMVGGALHPPEALTVKVPERGLGASYNFSTLTLTAPFRMIHAARQRNRYDQGKTWPSGCVYDVVRLKNPASARTVTAHEYGHALYHANIVRLWPGYDDFVERTRATAKTRFNELCKTGHQAFEAWRELKRRAKGASAEEARALNREMSRAYPEIADYTAALLYYGESFGRLAMDASYGELFADLIAVLHARDPRAVARSVRFSGETPASARRAAFRDFAGRRSATGVAGHSVHSELAQTRRHLWRDYLSRPSVMRRPGEFSAAVLRAIVGELRARDESRLYFLDADSANARLIRRLDAELARF